MPWPSPPRRWEVLEPRLPLASVGWDGPGRGSATLTYYIHNAPAGLTQSNVDATIVEALGVWADVADLTFTRTFSPNRRDSLDFEFGPIDSSGSILAQAYPPDDSAPSRAAGDIVFDSSESWEIGDARGGSAFDLLLVAVHEIGHALGLDHSTATDSIMAASVSASEQFTGLAAADRAAILALYARAPNEPTNPPVSYRNPRDAADVNDDGRVSPVDVLLLLNPINDGWAGRVELAVAAEPAAQDWFLDPTGDGQLTPADILFVLNRINGAAPAPSSLSVEPHSLYSADDGGALGAAWRAFADLDEEQSLV